MSVRPRRVDEKPIAAFGGVDATTEHGGARGPLCKVRGATDPRGDDRDAPCTRKHPEEPLLTASTESVCGMFRDGAALRGTWLC